jgi:hypothetical protein
VEKRKLLALNKSQLLEELRKKVRGGEYMKRDV